MNNQKTMVGDLTVQWDLSSKIWLVASAIVIGSSSD